MKVTESPLKGLQIIQPDVFEDNRGYFFESYNFEKFHSNGVSFQFVQDNQSLSQKGVLRGLHFQNPPFAQGKLVRVIKGSVLDISVDIRKDSITYGQHFAFELNEENKSMLFIPPGFAHGFLTLADNTIFFYKCTNYYNKASEDTLLWNDNTMNIDWKIENPIISEKDKEGKAFHSFVSLF